MKQYAPEEIRAHIDQNRERLFAPYAIGRPPGWNVDSRTKDDVCITAWLREELSRIEIDDLGRRTQEGLYNRLSRGEHDLFTLAAFIMNETLAGKIDRFRVPHRRWG